MRLLVLSLVGLLGSSAVALADPAATTTTAPAPANQPAATAQSADTGSDPNEIVCHTMAPPTGTRLGGRRICQTQKEWDDQQKLEAQNLGQMQNRSGQSGLSPLGNGGRQ